MTAPVSSIGAQRRAEGSHFESGRIRCIADKCISQCEGQPVGRTADRHAEAAVGGPAEIDEQRRQARFDDVQAHAQARISKP